MTIKDLSGLFIIDTNSLTCFPISVPMILEFKGLREAVEDTVENTIREQIQKEFDEEKREELLEEIKSDYQRDIQNGVDDYINELDTDLSELHDSLKSLRIALDNMDYSYRETQATIDRGLDTEDSC